MSITLDPTGPGTSASPGRHGHPEENGRHGHPEENGRHGQLEATGPAAGLELLGVPDGSGREAAPGLVRRADGQVLQLTPLLYTVLDTLDGQRDDAEVADRVSSATDVELDADDVRYLIDERLRPIGVLDGAAPETTVRANPLLALRWRYVITDPARTRRLTAPFAVLFHPLIVAAVLGGFAASAGWLAVHRGLAQAARQAVYQPGWLLSILVLTLLSAGFHEFGHAAAVRYGGGTPGAMGVGLYLLWPAFYTDVTDTYRLPRRDRLRVDLGGLYFNAVFGVAVMLLWAATGVEALLLLFAGQILQMARQLLPFLRYDGYHVLADLTGVPDLFQQMGPTLSSLRPRNWGRPSPSRLRRGARITVLVWTLVTVPFLAALLIGLLVSLPRILATSADSALLHASALRHAVAAGQPAAATLDLVQLVALALVPAGSAYLLWRTGRRALVLVRERTDGRPVLRAGAFALLACLLALVGWALAPDDDWTPLRTSDRGRLDDVLAATSDADVIGDPLRALGPVRADRAVGRAELSGASASGIEPAGSLPLADDGGPTATDAPPPTLPADTPPVTAVDEPREDEAVAAEDVPSPTDEPSPTAPTPTTEPATTDDDEPTPSETEPQEPTAAARTPFAERSFVTALPQPWPFGFSQPTPGREIDNISVAAVDGDGTAMRAFSTELVVAAPGTVDHRNEAFAFAQCIDCGAAAAAFQVVLLPAEHRVIVPRNLAGAVNDHCTRCDVTAVANQLVVSITQEPSAAVLAQIQGVLDGLAPLEAQLGTIPPGELRAHFYDAQRAVLRILAEADPTTEVTPEFRTEAAVADDGVVTTDRTVSEGVASPTGETEQPTTADETAEPTEPPAEQQDGGDAAVPDPVAVEPDEPEVTEEDAADGAVATAPPPDDAATGDVTTGAPPAVPSGTTDAATATETPDAPAEGATDAPTSPSDEQELVAREEDVVDTGA